MPFDFERLSIPEVILVHPRVFGDSRGFFLESYKHSDFAGNGIPAQFVQDNYSRSAHAVLRGLHYQTEPAAQGKLVMVVSGEIFDVAVDIRDGSPTYGKWASAVLSAENHRLLYVPPGFAHGFCVLSSTADVLYKVTGEYSAAHERGILWNDPQIGIDWPITQPELSERDKMLPLLQQADNNFRYRGGDS